MRSTTLEKLTGAAKAPPAGSAEKPASDAMPAHAGHAPEKAPARQPPRYDFLASGNAHRSTPPIGQVKRPSREGGFPLRQEASIDRACRPCPQALAGRPATRHKTRMIVFEDISLRIAGRLLIDHASAILPEGGRVGLVGRNGTGKTTLFRAITGDIALETGDIRIPAGARIGQVAQEAPAGPERLIDVVLAADTERAHLLKEREGATDPARIAEIELRLVDIDAHAAPARAARILAGLGFDEAAQQRPCSEFSGGWRMRVALAAVLFAEPDLLLLDEPTNYLDLEGTLWLQDYLVRYPRTVLIVSHDRELLNQSVQFILHLDQGKLTLWRGGYDSFERQRAEKQALDQKARAKQDARRKHMESFVERFRAKASKAKQAQSRLKALARMAPIAEAVGEQAAAISIRHPTRIPSPPILTLDGASAGYEPGKPVLRGLTLRIDHDDRIALLGPNGNGKSTFAKLIAGRLAPLGGSMVRAAGLEIAYLAQHQLDELVAAETVYDHVRRLMPDAPGGEGKVPRGRDGVFRSRGEHDDRGAVRRREGAAAARPRRLPWSAPAHPR